jgi:hypothetical protein
MTNLRMMSMQPVIDVFVVLLLVSSSVSATVYRSSGERSSISVTRFDDAITSVLSASSADQRRFAELAIQFMVDAYRTELGLTTFAATPSKSDVVTWGVGTRRFIDRLEGIAAAVANGQSVHIIKESHGAIRIVVGSAQVMLNAPRPNEQASFEHAIATSVCAYVMCSQIGNTPEERAGLLTSRLRSNWEFGPRSPPRYSSSDGLNCIFDDTRHLKLKKDACVSLLHEIRLLAESFNALKTHGKVINWSHLKIKHVGAGESQKLTYNSHKGFISIRLPGLVQSEIVLREAIPWIRASVQGRAFHHVIKLPNKLVYLTPTIKS